MPNGTISGTTMQKETLPEWEQVLASAAHLQRILPDAILIGGWKTARVRRPVQILGSLDGIETGIRQLIRDEPLETIQIEYHGEKITIPTEAEILRIKGVLILKRNATRDYLDFVALADHMGYEKMVIALQPFDMLYPQPNQESALQQLQVQLAQPLPFDLEAHNLAEYKNPHPRWHDWQNVRTACIECATVIFDLIIGLD